MYAEWSGRWCVLVILVFVGLGAAPVTPAMADLKGFCDRLPRPAYAAFEKHPASSDWFEVYQVESGIFAVYEPFQWQEVISYLIVGDKVALLFDTGNGIGNIREIIDQLTDKPIRVLNSHTHFDHIGGNHFLTTSSRCPPIFRSPTVGG